MALLLDNFSAHECAVAVLEDENLLPTVYIVWLPSRTTSKYQPMDQGVIRTWNAHYQRFMMQHIITYADAHLTEDPYDSINLLHAIRWGVDSWKSGVKASTLEHCLEASQVKIHGPFLPEALQPEDHALDDI